MIATGPAPRPRGARWAAPAALDRAQLGARRGRFGGEHGILQIHPPTAVQQLMDLDPRDGRYVTHELRTLLRQRVYQIMVGYEDANDASALRYDPTMQVVAHRPGVELASQPTLSRLENAIEWGSIARLTRLGVEWFEAHVAAPAEPILDGDSTDDPTHGAQQLSFFNGHYDEHMYHPLPVFEGTSGVLLGSRLRAGNEGGATRLRPLLCSIAGRLRVGRPGRRLVLRADGGFCNPEVLDYAEAAHLHDAIGLPRNSVLEAHVERACEQAQKCFARQRVALAAARAGLQSLGTVSPPGVGHYCPGDRDPRQRAAALVHSRRPRTPHCAPAVGPSGHRLARPVSLPHGVNGARQAAAAARCASLSLQSVPQPVHLRESWPASASERRGASRAHQHSVRGRSCRLVGHVVDLADAAQ